LFQFVLDEQKKGQNKFLSRVETFESKMEIQNIELLIF